ncbi:hypothetical protein WEI85_19995 [Actinomycetes bacterium KLBMP 9797]
MDRGLVGLLASLWAVCETRSCCEDEGGQAYVVPTVESCDAAVEMLIKLGLRPKDVGGIVYFQTPTSFRLDDAEQVRQVLEQPGGAQLLWRVNENGAFGPVPPADGSGVTADDT